MPALGGHALVLTAMVFGSGALVVAKFALEGTTPLMFSFLVTLFAAIFCGAWAWAAGDTAPPKTGPRGRTAFLGHVAGSFVGSWAMWTAVSMLGPAVVSFLSRVEIVISLTLAGVFLGERFRRIEWLGALVTVAGVVMMKLAAEGTLALVAGSVTGMGFFFAVLTAAGYATAENFAKVSTHSASPPAFAFYRNILLAAAFAVVLAAKGEFHLPDARTCAVAAGAALCGPVLARVLWLGALRVVDLSRAVILAQTHPLFTALLSWVFLGETLRGREWAGAAVLMTGCVIVAAGGAKVGRRAPAPVPPIPSVAEEGADPARDPA
jgi:drug/metabolite transporter (DMT)-like permease